MEKEQKIITKEKEQKIIILEDQKKKEIENEELIKIIWIEENILRDQKTRYYNELFKTIKQDCFEYRYFWFEAVPTVRESINFIKNLKFEATIIIVSLNLYYEFFVDFYNNMNDIFIIPKIIIFSKRGKIISGNKNMDNIIKNPFFGYGGIHTSFEEIKAIISKEIKTIISEEIKNKKNQKTKIIKFNKLYFDEEFIFDYIDKKEKLLLPMFYKVLIETKATYSNHVFIENLYNSFVNNKISRNKNNNNIEEIEDKNDILIKALKSIKSIKNIPIQLLSKYYARFYTYESDFCYSLNKDLRNNKEIEMSDYLPFIKALYEGVDLKSLPLVSPDVKLYRGSQVSIKEIEEIQNHEKIFDNLPNHIVFSKVFLSFSKDIKIAKYFLEQCKPNKNLCKVLFIIEERKIDNKIEYSLDTHTALEKVSFFNNEREVLFFPFSSFGIKKIEEKNINNENIFEIILDYLGKHLKELKKEEKLVIKEENKEDTLQTLPDSEFKRNIMKSGLVDRNQVETINRKEIFQQMDKHEKKIKDSRIKLEKKNVNKEFDNEEFEQVSLSNLTEGLTKKVPDNNKIKCTKCKIFSFILFLTMLIRVLLYFIVYIAIRNETYDINDLKTSFISKIPKTINNRILSNYSGNYYNCIQGKCKFINSNIINIEFRLNNNNYFNNNDLYLSIDGLNKNNNLIDKIYFGKLEGLNGSITLFNYNLRREDYKVKETLKINLDKIPYNISSLAVIINSNNNNNLLKIKGGYVRIYDEDTQNEISNFLLDNIKDGVIFLYGTIERTAQNNNWIFRRISKSLEERNISYNKIYLSETIVTKDIK